MLIIGKIINGIAIGMAFVTIPIYQYEIIPVQNRGRILSIFIFSCALGNLFIYVIRLISERFLNESKYSRLFWAIEVIPLVFAATFIAFIPESPKWLAANCEWTSAAEVLELIEVKNSSILKRRKTKEDRIRLGDKHYVIKKYSTGVCIKSCSINGLFGKKYIKEVCRGILLLFFVDFTSISKILESLDYICQSCQIMGESLKTVTIFLLLMRVLFATAPILIIDMMRRKDVLVFGMFLTTIVIISYMILFLGFSIPIPKSEQPSLDWAMRVVFYPEKASVVLALTVFLDVVYYSMLVPTCWLYIIETFSTSSRIKGWVVIMSLHWLFEACTSLSFSFLMEELNGWLFLIISFICLGGLFFTTQLEETKGKFEFDPEFIMKDSQYELSDDKTLSAQPANLKCFDESSSSHYVSSRGSKNIRDLTVPQDSNIKGKPFNSFKKSVKESNISKPIMNPWETPYGSMDNFLNNEKLNQQPANASNGNATVTKKLADAYNRL